MGVRPLQTRIAAQRERVDAGPGPAAAMPPAPVAARWSSAGDLPATVEAMPPDGFADEPVPLQRLASSETSPAPSAQQAPVPMREIVFPAPGTGSIPVAAVSGLGDTGLPPLQRSPDRRPAGRPAGGQPGSRSPRPAAAAQAGAATSDAAPFPTVARVVSSEASGQGSGSAAVVQATRPGPSPIPDISVRPVIQRLEDDGVPAGGSGRDGGRSEGELDELAQALFGRFRTRIRAEVIHEREALGLGFDAF